MNAQIESGAADTLADDLIWGLKAIGEYIGKDVPATHYLLKRGKLPGRQVGVSWVLHAWRGGLMDHAIHNVTLRRHDRPGARGYRYDAFLGHEFLCTALDPEYAACRVLVERGHTGEARFWREGRDTFDSFTRDIEVSARLCVREDRRRGPEIVPYKAFLSDDSEPRTTERAAA